MKARGVKRLPARFFSLAMAAERQSAQKGEIQAQEKPIDRFDSSVSEYSHLWS